MITDWPRDSSHLEIQIAIEDEGWSDEKELRLVIMPALNAVIKVAKLDFPNAAELSLLFCNDARIKGLNAQWREKNKATNVLSFPVEEIYPGDKAPQMLGDVVFARETIEREADLEGITFNHHLSHLMIHGFLHLFGYDHLEEAQAIKMESLETDALAELGIKNPYA